LIQRKVPVIPETLIIDDQRHTAVLACSGSRRPPARLPQEQVACRLLAPGRSCELPQGPDTGMTTLDAWFRDHVIGGPAAFLHVAQGYDDLGRAFRQKFVTEISER
jgi:hypothetical protein